MSDKNGTTNFVSSFMAVFTSTANTTNVTGIQQNQNTNVEVEVKNVKNKIPNDLKNTKYFSDQKGELDTKRMSSTIPQSYKIDPQQHSQKKKEQEHGNEASMWVYPSPQQFYNALRKKGFDPKEEDMNAVVTIHNSVNEKTWNEILRWEMLHCGINDSNNSNGKCDIRKVKLVKFIGRPRDYSFKARILNYMGYKLPFDRHDWIVSRCGQEHRYIIDFYKGKSTVETRNYMPSFYIDARPALETPQAFLDTFYMSFLTFADYLGLRSHKTQS